MSDETKKTKNRRLTLNICLSSSKSFALREASFLREHKMTMAWQTNMELMRGNREAFRLTISCERQK